MKTIEDWQRSGRSIYSTEQAETGDWIRKISTESKRGWHAFYHTKEWKHKRAEILKRDHYECQRCRAKRPAIYTRATTVHHIKHLNDEPELALTSENLISLCQDCHDAVHPEKHFRGAGLYKNVEKW